MSSSHALGFDAADWPRLSELLDDALALPEERREGWLDALAGTDRRLRETLASLLAGSGGPEPALPTLEGRPGERWHPGREVGPYRLLQQLGEGGMGSVWLARRADGTLTRPVALKLPRSVGGGFADRLARERDLLASLSHPHIARLYDAGIAEGGQPYLALELVAGEPIDRHCQAHRLGIPARLALFLQAAQAVAHAHARLIVHRDLKPSNLLVDADGQVKLLDFGIAKLLEPSDATDSTLTREGAPPMTPDYASPEQVAGSTVDTRSDVYSLGVLLFELLTGTRPYRTTRRTVAALEHAILDAEVPRPSEVAATPQDRRALRGDLDTIVLHALRKSPGERYPTVQALAEDIERHLQRRPVLARPDSLGYVLRRLVARHRGVFAASTAAVVAVLLLAAAALWQAHRADQERRRAGEVAQFLARLLRDASPYRPAAAESRMVAVVARLMRQAEPDGAVQPDMVPARAVDLLRRAGRQLEAGATMQPAVRAELHAVVAEGLMNFGDLAAAGQVVQRGVDEATRVLGPVHRTTLKARLVQAQLWRLSNRQAQSAAAVEELLPLLRAAPGGGEHELIVSALQLQALQALDFGVPAEAHRLAQAALALATQRLPAAHPEAISSATLASMASRLAGRPGEARAAAEQALGWARSAWGETPQPQAVEAAGALGRALADNDDAEGAAQAFESASSQAAALFGAASPMVALLRANTVPHLIDSGALAKAEVRSREALQVMAARLPEASYPRALAAAARGEVLLALHDADAALALLDTAAPALRRHLGGTAAQAVAAEALRVEALLRVGRREEARAAAASLAAEPSGPRVAATRLLAARARALLRHVGGDPAGAFQALAALAEAPARGSGQQRQAVLSRLALAALHEAAGDASAASREYEAALVAAAPLERGGAGALQAEAWGGLARIDLAAGRRAAAESRLARAREVWLRLYPTTPALAGVEAAPGAALPVAARKR